MTTLKRTLILAGLLLSSSLAGAADFIRLFPDAAPYMPPEEALVDLAVAMQDPNADADNSPAGTTSIFTYGGQFADHDMTLMKVNLADANDVALIENQRTARFDLDSMYGGGPGENPELYETDGRFKLASPNGFSDYPRRADGSAIINEPRNDENLVICQIQIVFMRYHNQLVEAGASFETARRETTYLWQFFITHEFLPHFVGQEMVDRFLSYNVADKPKIKTPHFEWNKGHAPGMPIEFSVAAYRFGHSMVRLAYVTKSPLPGQAPVKTQVFNAAANDLRGNRPIPPNLKIDWENFVIMPGRVPPLPPQLNISRAIDAQISKSMDNLPVGPVVEVGPPAVIRLSERNLLRGRRLGLPSYQDMARALGITPLTNAQLATAAGLGSLTDPVWEDKAPLWAGILGESKVLRNGEILGPTGGTIVAEVILGLLGADKDSYVNRPQPWAPPADVATLGAFFQRMQE